MTAHARRFASVPARTASDTWRAISDVLASKDERTHFDAAQNAAAVLIAEEVTETTPIVVTGLGPRIHIYTVHGDDAVSKHNVNEVAVPNLQYSEGWIIYLPDLQDEPGLLDALVNDPHVVIGSAPAAADPATARSSESRIGDLDLSALDPR